MNNILKTLRIVESQIGDFVVPSVTKVSENNDPYQVLISCILSLRTRDKTTIEASRRLFKVAKTPREMVKLSLSKIQKLIYPVGFYRTKAKTILGVNQRILDDFGGRVPDNIEDLLSLKGVGRKTANLVLGLGFGVPAICVDTHVNRIPNRIGWIKTKTPLKTEEALGNIVPRNYWIKLNTVLVTFGQNICLPVHPRCNICAIEKFCKKIGV